jgi:hypothetical protein
MLIMLISINEVFGVRLIAFGFRGVICGVFLCRIDQLRRKMLWWWEAVRQGVVFLFRVGSSGNYQEGIELVEVG